MPPPCTRRGGGRRLRATTGYATDDGGRGPRFAVAPHVVSCPSLASPMAPPVIIDQVGLGIVGLATDPAPPKCRGRQRGRVGLTRRPQPSRHTAHSDALQNHHPFRVMHYAISPGSAPITLLLTRVRASSRAARRTVRSQVTWLPSSRGRRHRSRTSSTGRLEAREHRVLRREVTGYLVAVRFLEGGSSDAAICSFRSSAPPFQAEVDRLRRERMPWARATVRARESSVRRDAREAVGRSTDVARGTQARGSFGRCSRRPRWGRGQGARPACRGGGSNLSSTRVMSPIDRRIGRAIVTRANLVANGPGEGTWSTTVVFPRSRFTRP